MIKFVYKICSVNEWKKFQKEKKLYGTKKDLLDGYIHLSSRGQINVTLKKYFFKVVGTKGKANSSHGISFSPKNSTARLSVVLL